MVLLGIDTDAGHRGASIERRLAAPDGLNLCDRDDNDLPPQPSAAERDRVLAGGPMRMLHMLRDGERRPRHGEWQLSRGGPTLCRRGRAARRITDLLETTLIVPIVFGIFGRGPIRPARTARLSVSFIRCSESGRTPSRMRPPVSDAARSDRICSTTTASDRVRASTIRLRGPGLRALRDEQRV